MDSQQFVECLERTQVELDTAVEKMESVVKKYNIPIWLTFYIPLLGLIWFITFMSAALGLGPGVLFVLVPLAVFCGALPRAAIIAWFLWTQAHPIDHAWVLEKVEQVNNIGYGYWLAAAADRENTSNSGKLA